MAKKSETTTTKKKNTSSKSSGKKTASNSKNSSSKRGAKQAAPQPTPIRREVSGVVCVILAMLCFIGYFNVEALFFKLTDVVKGLIGYGYWLLPPCLAWAGYVLLTHKGRPVVLRNTFILLLPLVWGIFMHMLRFGTPLRMDMGFGAVWGTLYDSGRNMYSGGAIGGLLSMLLLNTVSIYGAVPMMLVLMIVGLFVGARTTPGALIAMIQERRRYSTDAYEQAQPVRREKPVKEPKPVKQPKAKAGKSGAQVLLPPGIIEGIDISLEDDDLMPVGASAVAEDPFLAEDEYEIDNDSFLMYRRKPAVKAEPPKVEKMKGFDLPPLEDNPDATSFAELGLTEKFSPKAAPPTVRIEGPLTIDDDDDVVVPAPGPQPSVAGLSAALQGDGIFDEPSKKLTKKETAQGYQEIAAEIAMKEVEEAPAYVFPPMNLLRSGQRSTADHQLESNANRRRLEATLESFGVDASYVSSTRGPTVTRYDFELRTGVKLTKLTNLADDIALALGVGSVRIAPIPDKISTVGIEVPNKVINTVYLRDIIGSDNFKNAKSKVSFAIGEDIGGNSIVSNIAKLPHLLIAGTTGSGKSVCINCLLLSLLYKASPEEVKLIMIDPKMVELGVYNGIPHLYVPVVTDPKKAAGALQWSVVEMMKRYKLFSEAGVRDLAGYNALCERNGEKTMPQVVIVIDELADLMMVASKEVEESICRVAQMGRAAGMHLVIATQRPSADVITGLMKANIPSRIAFAVSSALESRIILDQQGAEKLIGMGDMLYAPIGVGKPVRIQGAFVSDEERESVIDFVKNHCEAEYDVSVQAQIEKAAAEKTKSGEPVPTADDTHSDYDELLPQAVDVVLEARQCSVSMLQRRLKLGYARAARIVDQMEEIGVVGPHEGSKPRQALITREQWLEMQTIRGTAPMETIPDLPEVTDAELFGIPKN